MMQVLAMFQKRRFLPSAGVETPLENFDWSSHHMILAQEVEPFPMDKRVVAAVNSFGIGGSYGHIILREWEVGLHNRRADTDSTTQL
jgi:acyl transferase domain-containing protein